MIYTTPEVACVGETEQSAREKGLDVQVVKAPMALSGRYLAENPKGTGFCKLLYDRKTAASWASIWSAPMSRRSSTARP